MLEGDEMSKKSNRFAEDPCSSKARQEMVDAARALLTAVTRMLIVADMIDVHVLLMKLEIVRGDLNDVKNANSNQELSDRCGKLNLDLDVLQRETAKRAIVSCLNQKLMYKQFSYFECIINADF